MHRIILPIGIICLLFPSFISAQKIIDKSSFEKFLSRFPPLNLPDTIQYSDDEFDFEIYIPEDESDTVVSKPGRHVVRYKDHVWAKPDSMLISPADVKSFLPVDTAQWIYEQPAEISDTILPDYFYSGKILTNKIFFCLVYEVQHISYNKKFVCTLTRRGKFIDRVEVASADFSGTGIAADGFRVPYFPDSKSIISPSLTIYYFKEGLNYITKAGSVNRDLNPDHVYQIEESGKIKKMF